MSKNVPEIRLANDTSTWNFKTLDEIFELRNGYTPSKAVKEYWEGGTIPWFRMEDIRAKGNVLKDAFQQITPEAVKGSGLFEPYSFILATTATIGVHAMLIADSLANQRFTNLKIRKSLSADILPFFVHYALNKIDEWAIKNTNSGGLLSVDIKGLMKQTLPTPSPVIQKAIADYFRSLEGKIEATSKRIESLRQMKAASMLAMFPQPGQSAPALRFKGFTENWCFAKLGDLFDERVESSPEAEMLSVTMNDGIIKASENGRFDNSNSDKSKYKLVKAGDIAYNSMRMWQGASGCSEFEGIVSPAYTVVAPKETVYSPFFGYMFKTISMIEKFRLNSQGLTSDNWNLKYPAFSKIEVIYPTNVDEQRHIATYFRSLDERIFVESKRLEKLKRIKAACLDKMFV